MVHGQQQQQQGAVTGSSNAWGVARWWPQQQQQQQHITCGVSPRVPVPWSPMHYWATTFTDDEGGPSAPSSPAADLASFEKSRNVPFSLPMDDLTDNTNLMSVAVTRSTSSGSGNLTSVSLLGDFALGDSGRATSAQSLTTGGGGPAVPPVTATGVGAGGGRMAAPAAHQSARRQSHSVSTTSKSQNDTVREGERRMEALTSRFVISRKDSDILRAFLF
ncbi:unnamed protein product [Ectocarpus sp. 12 AP-2014]